jgi:hypothetical protein
MVAPGDSEQVANAIELLWREKEIYQLMQINTRKLMEQQFDKRLQFDRFFEYFEGLLTLQ